MLIAFGHHRVVHAVGDFQRHISRKEPLAGHRKEGSLDGRAGDLPVGAKLVHERGAQLGCAIGNWHVTRLGHSDGHGFVRQGSYRQSGWWAMGYEGLTKSAHRIAGH